MNVPKQVRITEVGPRDGLQNEPINLPTVEKINLIKNLVQAGVKEIEATSFVHPKWTPNLADAEEVLKAVKDLPATLFALVPNARGYERALKSGVHGVTFVLSATDSHSQKNLNRTTQDSITELKALVARAKSDGLKIRASLSTVFGCPFEGNPGLDRVLQVVDQLVNIGFERIGLCDTIGIANPAQVYDWVSKIRKEFTGIDFELHFHDTYGRGLANVIAGLDAGIVAFDSSVGGLGGCPYAPGATGNISSEDLVDMLHNMGIETGIQIDGLIKASDALSKEFQKPMDSQIWKVWKSRSAVK